MATAGIQVISDHGSQQITSETSNLKLIGRFWPHETKVSPHWETAGVREPVYENRVSFFSPSYQAPLVFFPNDQGPCWLSGITNDGGGNFTVYWTSLRMGSSIVTYGPFHGSSDRGIFEVYKSDGSLAFSTGSKFLKIERVFGPQTEISEWVGLGAKAVAASIYPSSFFIVPSEPAYWNRYMGWVFIDNGQLKTKATNLYSTISAPILSAMGPNLSSRSYTVIDISGV